MDIDHYDYARRGEAAMTAAGRATSMDERQILLARAVHYASLASIARRRSHGFNVVPLRLAGDRA